MKSEDPVWLQSLKWIGILPGSIVASVIVYWIWRFIHTLTAARYIEPDSWMNIIFMEVMSSGLMGAAFVYTGVWIAPKKKKIVACVLAGVTLVLSGMSLSISVLTRDYFPLVAIGAMNVGSVAMAVAIVKGEVESLKEPNEDIEGLRDRWS